ncbi:hypothetical protein Droror1_Dr00020240 [Drosera rotundifolia]
MYQWFVFVIFSFSTNLGILFHQDQKAHRAILKVLDPFSVEWKEPELGEWTLMTKLADRLNIPVKVAMVGKYTGLSDSYLSVLKALLHASVALNRKLVIDWVPVSDLEDATKEENPKNHQASWNLLEDLFNQARNSRNLDNS